jgi:hypothetical protein
MIILKWYKIYSSVKCSWLGKLNDSSMKRTTRCSKNCVNSLKCRGCTTSTKCSAMLIKPYVLWINLSSTPIPYLFSTTPKVLKILSSSFLSSASASGSMQLYTSSSNWSANSTNISLKKKCVKSFTTGCGMRCPYGIPCFKTFSKAILYKDSMIVSNKSENKYLNEMYAYV